MSPGNGVLADRGFTVDNFVDLYNAHLKIPAFTKRQQQVNFKQQEE